MIKKDIQNIQTLFLKNEDGKEMYSLITHLEDIGYVVRIQVKPDQEVKSVFFIHEDAIYETRRWPEAITIDATYKTNAHKFSLINIVGISNVSSVRGTNRLQTFAVAAAFVNAETEAAYTWVLEELRNAIWPEEKDYELPNVFVTDNERALRNAIDNVFPESHHLLCSWHLWNTMETKLPIGKVNAVEYRYRRCLAEEQFKAIVGSNKEQQYLDAVSKFEQIVTETDCFKDNGRSALIYLKEV